MAYVGTFSSPLGDVLPTQVDLPAGNGRGIHLFQVNRATGALTPVGIHEMGTSPSWLVLNAAGNRLYSANETDRVGEDKQGTVSAFSIDRGDGHLTLLGTVPSGGAGPTHLSIHPSGRFLLVANYFSGSVAVLPIRPDGRLDTARDIKNVAGKMGPTKATNAPPGSFAISGHDGTHAHMIDADPSGRFVLHIEVGMDQIFVWKFDEQSGVLTPNEPPAVSLPPGDGPRHFHFHPKGRWLYSLQEEASTIVLFDYDAPRGRLTPRQTISTLPPARQHRDLRRWPKRRPHLPRSRVDTRGLSAQLQLRPHGPVPLLLQSASRQHRRLPGEPQDRRPQIYRLLHSGWQSFAHRFSRSRQGGLKPGDSISLRRLRRMARLKWT
jgi:6-phosphogluconolactonase (cycloisomerase 2 family)